MTETLPLSAVKARLSELVDRVESEDDRIVVTRNGRPAAVLVSTDDLESLEETLAVLSDRELVFSELRPTPPEFQLAGDSERVAITCAALGVDAAALDLPVPLDRAGYRRAVGLLTSRGLVEDGRLIPVSAKRYQVAPPHPIPERVDWAG